MLLQKNKILAELVHVSEKLSWGGEVIILNDGAIITAEDKAMLQALHSRNPKGLKEHLKILAEKGSGNMMSSFYVGYGHKSIGDCGVATVFIEGVSMLAAKAIQDSQLYNGQECSTRYIDFSSQPFFNPINLSLEPHTLLEKLRDFYVTNLPKVITDLQIKYPKKENEEEKIHLKAIKARAFDILRGFLPAAATTNLAWTTTLRQLADRMMYLRHHPLKEVQEIAKKLESALQKNYPNSFNHKKYEDTEKFNQFWMQDRMGYLLDVSKIKDGVKVIHNGVNKKILQTFNKFLKARKNKTELPKPLAVAGNLTATFLLDFGSWRDLQRHRAVVQRMPKLTIKHGFEKWYLQNLPREVKSQAETLLKSLEKDLKKINEAERSYFIPMGYKVPVVMSGDLPALIYLVETRATSTVHPTLQKKAAQLGDLLLQKFDCPIFINKQDVGRFDVRRGTNDIILKK